MFQRLLPILILALITQVHARESFLERQTAADRERGEQGALIELARIGSEIDAPFPNPNQLETLNTALHGEWSEELVPKIRALTRIYSQPLEAMELAASRPLTPRFPHVAMSDPSMNLLAQQTTARIRLAKALLDGKEGDIAAGLEGCLVAARAGFAMQVENSSLIEAMIGMGTRRMAVRVAGRILAFESPMEADILEQYANTLGELHESIPHPVVHIAGEIDNAAMEIRRVWAEAGEDPPDDQLKRRLLDMMGEEFDGDPGRDVDRVRRFVQTHLKGTTPEFLDALADWDEGEERLLKEINPLAKSVYAGDIWVGYIHRDAEVRTLESLTATSALLLAGMELEDALASFPDPYTGREFHHEDSETPPGFLLRSTGPNRTLDGGTNEPDFGEEKLDGDYTWPWMTPGE